MPFNPKLASLMKFITLSDNDDVIDLGPATRIFGPPRVSLADYARQQLVG